MYFSSFSLRALSALPIIAGLASAHPADTSALEQRADVPCDKISKYDVQFFKDNACKKPVKGNVCVFYTEGLSEDAQSYAGDLFKGISIWEFMPIKYYIGIDEKSNPLRCIFKDSADRLTYFENMSEAFAYYCDGFALVMTKDVNDVPLSGVFGRVELPTIKKSNNAGKVGTMDVIDKNGEHEMLYYSRNNPPSEGRQNQTGAEIFKPAAAAATCGGGSAAAARFDKGGKYPVKW